MAENQFFHQFRNNADEDQISDLEQVCNFTQDQSVTLILDGYDNAEYIIHWEFDGVRKGDNDKYNIVATRGEQRYGNRSIKCLQGLVYCITNTKMYGEPVVLDNFDQKVGDLATDINLIHNYKQQSRGRGGREAAAIENYTVQMGGQNASNRVDMIQIPDNHSVSLIN